MRPPTGRSRASPRPRSRQACRGGRALRGRRGQPADGQGAPLPRVLGTIFSEVGLIRPDFVIWTGDTVYGYCDTRDELEAEYRAFAAAARPLAGAVPLYNSPGNHEIHRGADLRHPRSRALRPALLARRSSAATSASSTAPSTVAGAHFIALDTDAPAARGRGRRPAARMAEAGPRSQQGRASHLRLHPHGVLLLAADRQTGGQQPSADRQPRRARGALPALPVKAVFSGHEHVYWREPAEQHDGIDYFVLGGAARPSTPLPTAAASRTTWWSGCRADQVSYEVIEPGRLYLQDLRRRGPRGGASGSSTRTTSAAPAAAGHRRRGAGLLGRCERLEATAETRQRDKPVPISGVSHQLLRRRAGGKLRLHIEGPPVGQGSFLVTVKPKPKT